MRNPIDRSNCARCGTPLLIVSPTRSLDPIFEDSDGLEEHLLERISSLETEVIKLRVQNDRLLDLLHRQATASFNDHALLNAIVDVLEDHGSVRPGQVESRWFELLEQYNEEIDERERIEERVNEILGAYSGDEPAAFSRLVDEGLQLLLEGDVRRGLRRFERAQRLDPTNVPLGVLLGEYFFFDGKRTLARHYLESVAGTDKVGATASLMLGVLCGDDGEPEEARAHFEHALELRNDSFVAHYGLGRLDAVEGRFREALDHFKRALSISPSAEMHYLVGRTYLEQERADRAERHLRKAVEIDPQFDAALYHLGLIYLDRSDVSRAREYFRLASEVRPEERRYKAALAAETSKGLVALPVFGPGRVTRKQSMTSGDARFTTLLMQSLADDVMGSPASTADESHG
jgi:tetratricopeptide (TPR) repeat protein